MVNNFHSNLISNIEEAATRINFHEIWKMNQVASLISKKKNRNANEEDGIRIMGNRSFPNGYSMMKYHMYMRACAMMSVFK